ncbi:MAG: hypothetical protein KDD51_00555 [Bdellovibrionales bacterium]|nr:hypothetical protein [Bdellovibrionales bacterium]
MGFLRKHFLIVIAVLASLSVAVLYRLLTPKQYTVFARVVVNRSQIETPNLALEDTKNRWVWVRDGYAIKEALLSGEYLGQLIDELPLLKERYSRFQDRQGARVDSVAGATPADLRAEFVRQVSKELNVDFLGGDSFTYVLSARDPNPLLAKRLLSKLIDRIRYLVVEEPKAVYQNGLLLLRNERLKKQNPTTQRFLDETYQSLLVASLLFEAQAPRRLEIVQRPAIPLESSWPKSARLFLLALAIGVTLGLALEYLIHLARQTRVQTA